MRVGDSIFLRNDGRWEARYCKERREDGSIRYGSVYGRTHEEAAQKRAKLLAEVGLPQPEHKDEENEKKLLGLHEVKGLKLKPVAEEPLDEETTQSIEALLFTFPMNIRLSVALSLYMGLNASELCALRYSDIDIEKKCVTISRRMHDQRNVGSVYLECIERSVPMPSIVVELLPERIDKRRFVLTGKLASAGTVRKGANLIARGLCKRGIADNINLDRLTATFIRRMFEAGVNSDTISQLIGVDKVFIDKKYSKYAKAAPELIELISQSAHRGEAVIIQTGDKQDSQDRAALSNSSQSDNKQMNLLILGAGSQGPVVKEIADAIGIFNEIAYLDDNPQNQLAIDTCENYKKYLERVPLAIPSFGNCELRAKWYDRLEKAGFITPKLIHPSATISSNVEIAKGTVIEAKVILSPGVKIGENCIISAGSVIDKEATIGANTHIDCASTVPKGSIVPEYTRLGADMVFTSGGKS